MERIACFCINPAIDLTIWTDGYSLSEPVGVKREIAYAGGKGINVSKFLSAAGNQNIVLGLMGKENSREFISLLQKDDIRFCLSECEGKTRENLSIVFPDGKMLKINKDGKILADEKLSVLRGYASEVYDKFDPSKTNYSIFSGSLPPSVSKETAMELILEARNSKVCIDTTAFSKEDYRKLKPFLIKPNHLELGEICSMKIQSVDDIIKAASHLTDHVGNILCSFGANGVVLVSGNRAYHARVPRLEAVSTIGAGDATMAGFVSAHIKGLSLSQCVKTAAAFGSSKVLIEGTGNIKMSDVEMLLNEITVEEISF